MTQKFIFLWIFCSLYVGSVLKAQNLRMHIQIPKESYLINKSYSLTICADSTQPGTFSEPQIEESPLFTLKFVKQFSQSFVEEGKEWYGIRYEYLFTPQKEGEIRFVPKIHWSPKGKKESILCPPQHLTLKFTNQFSQIYVGYWIVGGIFLILLPLLIRRKQKKELPLTEVPIEVSYLERLSDLSRYRMEGNFKQYFAGLETLFLDYSKENVSLPSEFPTKITDLKKLSEQVQFASSEASPNELEGYTEYINHLLEKNRKQKRKN